MTEKTIILKTNYNHKLSCDRFIHIQLPGENGVPEQNIFKIITADNSHPPVMANLFDSCRQKLSDLSATFIYLSHGIDADEFRNMLARDAPAITNDTELAVYFYKKILPVNE